MWEIFTIGAKPYQNLQNTDVAEYLNTGNRLPRPINCPSVIYDVMFLCWAENPKDRPSFNVLAPQLEVC